MFGYVHIKTLSLFKRKIAITMPLNVVLKCTGTKTEAFGLYYIMIMYNMYTV